MAFGHNARWGRIASDASTTDIVTAAMPKRKADSNSFRARIGITMNPYRFECPSCVDAQIVPLSADRTGANQIRGQAQGIPDQVLAAASFARGLSNSITNCRPGISTKR